MKKCNDCGQMMNEDAKFCTNCGVAFNAVETTEHVQVTNTVTPENTNSTEQTESNTSEAFQAVQSNITEAVKSVEYSKIAQGYWSYLMMTLKKPSTSFAVTDRTNGWIQFILLAVLNSLVFVSILASIPGSETGFGIFFRLFFVQLFISIAEIGILFVFKNLVQKVNAPFNVVASQYGGLQSLNIVLLSIILVSSLISPIAMISIILIGSILIGIVNIIAFNMYLLNGQNNSKLDNFYVTVLANAVVLIILAIIVRIGMEMMIDMLPYMFNEYMFNQYMF
ncbi:zinc ribbon domain-containing protein [Marinilactibacillus sp. Marseille-P9653]|uniref:zinc ribbon domain-containing protein n=1 Tax=Marinilactibacillus sp. Marseille-P9653 TaxID=2866583 RepID=UPI001CE4225E|nr:zinc ribbon domain-containing protein [Marinilactibacillus sp. Marseille-P9653]